MNKIVDVIKYEGDNTTFVWKHPNEDFNTGTQLIVHESQEAVFFMNGQALDLFGPGRHTLETQNIPLMQKLINKATGGQTAFHCEVYFINKSVQMAIKWGTDSKIHFKDPIYDLRVAIGASGTMNLLVSDSRKLLIKLVGTETSLDQSHISRYFRSAMMTDIKSYLSKEIKEKNVSVFEMDEHLKDFSLAMTESLAGEFAEYGIELKNFLVSTIAYPDGDAQYETIKGIHAKEYIEIADAQRKLKVDAYELERMANKRRLEATLDAERIVVEGQALADKRAIEGYTYEQQRSFDIAQGAAENEGVGNFTSAGIGLGMMSGIGGAIGGTVNSAFQGQNTPSAAQPVVSAASFCGECGHAMVAGAQFCAECGTKAPSNACTNCNHVFESPSKFCPQCGTKRGL